MQRRNSRITAFRFSGIAMLIAGVLLTLFGTRYIVVTSDTVGIYLLQPLWYAFASLNPYGGAVVVFTDYTLNAVGIALSILGILFATVSGKARARRLSSGFLIAIGVASVLAGYGVYGIYRSIPIAPSPLEPYFPATNVPFLGVVRLVPLMNSLMIDGALFIVGGLILLLLSSNRNPVSENTKQEAEKILPPI